MFRIAMPEFAEYVVVAAFVISVLIKKQLQTRLNLNVLPDWQFPRLIPMCGFACIRTAIYRQPGWTRASVSNTATTLTGARPAIASNLVEWRNLEKRCPNSGSACSGT